MESAHGALIGLRFSGERREPRHDTADVPPILESAADQLLEYFAGERTQFDLKTDPDGTEFQLRVWTELGQIPYGQTVTYGELARRVGRPGGRARWARPTAPIHSPSSCPAIASWPVMVSGATAVASRSSVPFWRGRVWRPEPSNLSRQT